MGTADHRGSFCQRTPGGLAYIACRRGQSLLDASIAGDCGQYTTASNLGRVDDELAVWCDARRFVERALGEHLHLPCREILQRDVETIAVAPHEDETLVVGQMSRRDVVAAFVGHALDRARGERQTINLQTAAAVRGEQDRPPVRREIRLGVNAR